MKCWFTKFPNHGQHFFGCLRCLNHRNRSEESACLKSSGKMRDLSHIKNDVIDKKTGAQDQSTELKQSKSRGPSFGQP